MAYLRSVITRSSLLKRNPSLTTTYLVQHQDHDDYCYKQKQKFASVFQETGFQSKSNFDFIKKSVQERKFTDLLYFSPTSNSIGAPFRRYMSTNSGITEVADAVAHSPAPAAAIQHVIDAVHSFTGFNWWASIVVTTLLFRTAMLPMSLHSVKTFIVRHELLPLHLERLRRQMIATGMDPVVAAAEIEKQELIILKEYGVSDEVVGSALMLSGILHASVYFFLLMALLKMQYYMKSFASGGAFWFVDLSAPDNLYILPVLSAFTFWMSVWSNPTRLNAKDAVIVSNVGAAALFLFGWKIPTAVYCFLLTSNLFTIVYGVVIEVNRKLLGIPRRN